MDELQLTNVTYHAVFKQDEANAWFAFIEEIPQVHTFGRTLGKAREYIVDALALWLDEPASTVKDLILFQPIELPLGVQRILDEARAARAFLEASSTAAATLTSEAALALTKDARLSLRDTAELLNISHQRVQQLITNVKAPEVTINRDSANIAQDIAQSLKEFLPGGSKEDLGAFAAIVAVGVAFVWTQTHE